AQPGSDRRLAPHSLDLVHVAGVPDRGGGGGCVGPCAACPVTGSFRRADITTGIVVVMFQLALLASLQQTPSPKPDNSYLVFVASEGFDQVALLRFGPTGLRIEHRTLIRLPATDSVGPRALRITPDGRDYYVTTARGFPTGELLKVRIAADS